MKSKQKKQLKVTLIKSKFGRIKGHIDSVHGLGLRRIRHSVILEDTSSIRGMIAKVAYLVKVEEV